MQNNKLLARLVDISLGKRSISTTRAVSMPRRRVPDKLSIYPGKRASRNQYITGTELGSEGDAANSDYKGSPERQSKAELPSVNELKLPD